MASSPNYPATGHAGARSGTNGKAVAALVLGIVAIMSAIVPFVGPVLGAIALGLGVSARSQIGREGGSGAGQALAGVILGAVALVIGVGILVLALTS